MRYVSTIVSAVVLVSIVFVGQFPSPAAGGAAEDESAIKELLAKRDAAWNAHDAAAWSAFFASDAHFTSWRGDRVQGRENIRVFHEPLFKGMYRQTKNTVLSTQITFYAPDLVIVEAVTQLIGALDPADKPVPDRRYYPLVVLKKNNEKWEIVIFHNVRDQT
jgi:uncharacterized protein (TIGR02246 family)